MARPLLRAEVAGADFLTLTSPPDWDSVFRRGGPLELEVGAGLGIFAIAHCRRYPRTRYIAIEKRKKYAREAAFRAQGLPNLIVIEGDALSLIPRLFLPGQLDTIRIHFPDPWWKTAHRHRTVIADGPVAVYRDFLRTLGMVDLRTDVAERATRFLEAFERGGFYNPAGSGKFHPAVPGELPSARERRFLTIPGSVFRARLLRLPGGKS